MTTVGILGLGMMGLTHLDIYRQRSDVRVAALCDIDADRLHGRTRAYGNIDGQAQGGVGDLSIQRYERAEDLIADPQIQVVDICLPTDLHVPYGIAALEAGKHVIIEKPLGRSADEAQRLADAAAASTGFAFAAHCMRFWPGWTWLKEAIDAKRYGKVLAATFRRVATAPSGTFYMEGERSGGALLDLHIHDTDFIHYCFGKPQAVQSVGYSKITSAIDHVHTRYLYDDIPLVVAEGSWAMAEDFGFSMAYCVNFERVTVTFNSSARPVMMLYEPGVKRREIEVKGMGYAAEIDYFLQCIAAGRAPETITLQDAADAVRITEAEHLSIREGGASVRVTLHPEPAAIGGPVRAMRFSEQAAAKGARA
ncbi:MAG: gfo/Idh/MocA family oxidoreductase [Planctomycetes bacterium]|nr:gfo/Idh/MocA family oxidoreductase [Planctomycetota bacterium]